MNEELHAMLASLKDIHLPDAPTWWPPAYGYWLLLIVLTLVLSAALLWLYYNLRHFKLKRLAVKELDNIAQGLQKNQQASLACAELSILLRRLTLYYYGPSKAGVTGEAWLQFLDEGVGQQAFSQGVGRYLLALPYRPEADIHETKALVALVKLWLRKQR